MFKILVPTDGSDLSLSILPHVEVAAHCTEAEVILLQVVRPPTGHSSPRYRPVTEDVAFSFPEGPVDVAMAKYPVYQEQEMDSIAANVRAALMPVEERLRAKGIQARTEVLFGRRAEQILAYIDREGIDMLAMATRARRGLERLIYGSVARQVLQKLTIPVLLLRTPKEGSQAEQRQAPFAEL